jgi:hypothetical protein
MRKIACIGLGALALTLAGCTIRHSRTLDNASPTTARRVSASSTGLEIFSIEINDTASAASLVSQLKGGCKSLKNVDVDYRTMVILIVGIPKLTVSADCD